MLLFFDYSIENTVKQTIGQSLVPISLAKSCFYFHVIFLFLLGVSKTKLAVFKLGKVISSIAIAVAFIVCLYAYLISIPFSTSCLISPTL